MNSWLRVGGVRKQSFWAPLSSLAGLSDYLRASSNRQTDGEVDGAIGAGQTAVKFQLNLARFLTPWQANRGYNLNWTIASFWAPLSSLAGLSDYLRASSNRQTDWEVDGARGAGQTAVKFQLNLARFLTPWQANRGYNLNWTITSFWAPLSSLAGLSDYLRASSNRQTDGEGDGARGAGQTFFNSENYNSTAM